MKINQTILFLSLISLLFAQASKNYIVVQEGIPIQIKPVQPLAFPEENLLEQNQIEIKDSDHITTQDLRSQQNIYDIQQQNIVDQKSQIIEINQKKADSQSDTQVQIAQDSIYKKHKKGHRSQHKHHGKKSHEGKHKKHQKKQFIEKQNQIIYQQNEKNNVNNKNLPLCKFMPIIIITIIFVVFLMKRCVVTRENRNSVNINDLRNRQIQTENNSNQALKKQILYHYDQVNKLKILLNEHQKKMMSQEYVMENVNRYEGQNKEVQIIPVGRPIVNQNLYPRFDFD